MTKQDHNTKISPLICKKCSVQVEDYDTDSHFRCPKCNEVLFQDDGSGELEVEEMTKEDMLRACRVPKKEWKRYTNVRLENGEVLANYQLSKKGAEEFKKVYGSTGDGLG